MELNNLSPAPGSTHSRKRVGRGVGSGLGKTSGKGHKGQKARSGGGVRPGFEGGQMPIARRVPKRGFTNFSKKVFEIVNVGDFAKRTVTGPITPEVLVEMGLIKNLKHDVKLLATGEVTAALEIHVHKASAAAVAKIEKAGGKVQVL